MLIVGGAILIAVAVAAILWPRVLAIPFALLAAWFGGALLVRAYHIERRREPSGPAASGSPVRRGSAP